MSTMNISLPDSLKSFVDEQVASRGYGASSVYARALIRRDQERQQLRTLQLEGAASARAAPATALLAGAARERYLAASRAADARDYGPLLAFVRS
jgi:antitoxin ParD1/3/4